MKSVFHVGKVWMGVFAIGLALGPQVNAWADLSSDMQTKVERYKKKLMEWAANPAVIKAVKEANAHGGMAAGMNNAKWNDLSAQDPVVTSFQNSEAGKLLGSWEQDKAISKLYLRDDKGNLVASSNNKPALYNIGDRPTFTNGIKGPWAANEAKPDPATKINGVQVSVPVMEEGKAIGVIQTAVVAD